MDSEPHHT